MKLPYKYPYVSIFIVSYYLLEHEGYYYKLRDYFGYPTTTEISSLVSLTSSNFDSITKAPGRKSLIFLNRSSEQTQKSEFNRIARKYKEKLRSPILFAETTCEESLRVCDKEYSLFSLLLLNEGEVTKSTSDPVSKKAVKRMLKPNT